MKKKPFYERVTILMIILCVPTIGSTQLGWYFFGKQFGLNLGMIVGCISVTVAAYLMYIKGWRDEDDDY